METGKGAGSGDHAGSKRSKSKKKPARYIGKHNLPSPARLAYMSSKMSVPTFKQEGLLLTVSDSEVEWPEAFPVTTRQASPDDYARLEARRKGQV